MGENDDEFVDDASDDSQQQKSGGGIRKQLEKVIADNAELKKALEAATAKATSFELSTVFAKLGVPEKIRTLYNGEPQEDAITKWVSDYKDVFGLEPNVAEPGEETNEVATALKGVQRASSVGAGTADNVTFKRLDDLLAKSGPRSQADLIKALVEEGFSNEGIAIPRELS